MRRRDAALPLLLALLVALPSTTTTTTTTSACPPALAGCACDSTSISCFGVSLAGLPADALRNGTNATGITRVILLGVGLSAETLPPTLFRGLTALRTLDLGGNSFTSLPPGLLEGLPSLASVGLMSNALTTVPTLGDVPSLKRLMLDANAITSVPSGVFRGLSGLEALFLGNTAIASLEPGAFAGLPSLKVIQLGANRLTTLPPTTFQDTPRLVRVELQETGLTRLPARVFRGLGSLQVLTLNNNRLTSLDASLFSGLDALTGLNLGSNQVTSLPEGIFNGLANLTTLDLSNNNVTALPDGVFTNLTRLKDLDISSNNVTALPANVLASQSPFAVQNIVLSQNGLNNATQLEGQLNVLNTFATPTFFLGLAANPAFCTYSSLVLQFVCQCSPLFDVQGDLCVPPAPVVRVERSTPVGVIAGSVVGGLVGGALIVVLTLGLQRRFRGLRVELDLRQSLLESQEMENLELKRAWDIDPRDVDLGRRIDGDSPGTFGEVWYAEWDGLGVAVKRLRLAMAELDATAGREFETEVDLLRKCRHRNIVRFFGAGTWDEGRGLPFLVTEYLENGAMSTYLQAHGGEIGWAQKRRWCVEIQAGMEYIHGLGRIHRDLKTGNVLLSLRLRAKIADFGSMKDILVGGGGGGGGGVAAMMAPGFGGDASTRTMTAGVGTPLYMAPEIIRGERYGPSADVWSLGVVVWEIATQERPDLTEYVGEAQGFSWSGLFMGRLEAALVAGHRLPVAGLPELLRPIVAACWGLAPLGRPSIGELGEMLAGFAEASTV